MIDFFLFKLIDNYKMIFFFSFFPHQVTAAMDVESKTGVKPALGLAWSEEVTMRLMMTRPEAVDSEEECQKV